MRLLSLAGVAAVACLVLPAAAWASCEKVAGEHHGRFNVDKRADVPNSGRPDNFDGHWTLTIDAQTCAITGEIESSFTDKIAMQGTYGQYNPDTSKFKTTNLYMESVDSPDISVVFETVSADHLLHYVLIQSTDYEYDGSFDGK